MEFDAVDEALARHRPQDFCGEAFQQAAMEVSAYGRNVEVCDLNAEQKAFALGWFSGKRIPVWPDSPLRAGDENPSADYLRDEFMDFLYDCRADECRTIAECVAHEFVVAIPLSTRRTPAREPREFCDVVGYDNLHAEFVPANDMPASSKGPGVRVSIGDERGTTWVLLVTSPVVDEGNADPGDPAPTVRASVVDAPAGFGHLSVGSAADMYSPVATLNPEELLRDGDWGNHATAYCATPIDVALEEAALWVQSTLDALDLAVLSRDAMASALAED